MTSPRPASTAAPAGSPPAPAPEEGEAAPLPPALGRLLAALPAGPDRERLEALFAASSKAIRALGELDLARFETTELHASDLGVWESLAPFVHDTFLEVQAFLAVIEAGIPAATPAPETDPDEAFDALLSGEPTPPHPHVDRGGAVAEAFAVIRDIAGSLSRELTAFGEGLRRPAVAADRWNLLAHAGEFRGKFRLGIGEIVYVAARAFADVRKAEVVPFYREETDDAVLLRKAFALVAAAVHAENERLKRAPSERRREAAERVLGHLEALLGSRAWRLVRADDKRAVLEARRDLAALAADPSVRSERLATAVEGLDKFLGSLSVINRRETLIAHDREALAAVARRVERAEAALDHADPGRARADLKVALDTARRLVGRDGGLDALLGSLKRVDPATLDAPALGKVAAALRERIALVPRP